jgi:hypothetical protein
MLQFDPAFLEVVPEPIPTVPLVNVYELFEVSSRERSVDLTLEFFLDPTEQHGLGSLVIDALLWMLDGSPVIGGGGKTDALFEAEEYTGSDAWTIAIQDYTAQGLKIDVHAKNTELGLAVVIENKINAGLYNSLEGYARHALADEEISDVLVVVLAPGHQRPSQSQENWLSRPITYTELADEIKRSPHLVDVLLAPGSINQRRSLDLLQQFIEARTGGTDVTDLSKQAVQLDEWQAFKTKYESEIQKFEEVRNDLKKTLKSRSKGLAGLLADRLPPSDRHWPWGPFGLAFSIGNGYYFAPEDWSVELYLTTNPDPERVMVKSYEGHNWRRAKVKPLGIEWTASDEEIADAFVVRVRAILEEVRDGGQAMAGPEQRSEG